MLRLTELKRELAKEQLVCNIEGINWTRKHFVHCKADLTQARISEREKMLEEIQLYFDNCMLLKKVPKFNELKERL
jgi:hypothetical protein